MQRRLTAILSADVAEFSSLMEADEAGTLERLKDNRRRIFDPSVAAHGGRLVKLIGDGALVEFGSVIAAVNCGLAIQQGTEHGDPRHADAKPLRYRIGINLGDVIIEGDDIYGEGVNVAARLQAMAPVGGIAVSATVRDHVAGKVACAFEDLGEHTVKNIVRPVHVFVLRPADDTPEAVDNARTQGRVTICVLPFANMSGDPEQEYFSDGISEDIITDLSKVSALWVAARNTAFTFKGKHVDVPQVARQLKVGHVLEGSVRKAGGRVRITAQLIDGATGGHVWAERYDRDLQRHLRAAGRDLAGHRRRPQAQAPARGEEGHRAARDNQPRSLQALSDGAPIQDHRQLRRRPPQRIDHPAVPPRDRDRPGLCAPWALMAHAQGSLRFITEWRATAGSRPPNARSRSTTIWPRPMPRGRASCWTIRAATRRCAKSRPRCAWTGIPAR